MCYWFKKWAAINRASVYILYESKIRITGLLWSPHFTSGSIVLKIETKNVGLVRRLEDKTKAQGVDVVVTKYTRRYDDETYYNVVIEWSELKRYLCNEELREQLIHSAIRAVENCEARNMLNKGRKRDCNQIPPAK